MTTKEIRLSDAQASKLLIAGAVYDLTTHDFIMSAVNAALQCLADEDRRIAIAFEHIDSRESERERIAA